jgi:hypothetical protein
MKNEGKTAKEINESVRGQVRQLKTFVVGKDEVWQFIIKVMDKDLNELKSIPIEIRSSHINGIINDGDEVEVFEKWNPPQMMLVFRVFNHSTNSEVVAYDIRKDQKKFKKGCFFILIIVAVTIFALIMSISNK